MGVDDLVRRNTVMRVNGGRPLKGEVEVRGAKNFVPKAMVAALLADTPSVLYNVPEIADVEIVSDMLRLHGAKVDYDPDAGELRIDPAHIGSARVEALGKQAGQSRIPILFCGPLLHRLGTAMIPNLGGCQIGDRPIDYHLSMLRAFGAEIEKVTEGIRITAPKGLEGTTFTLEYPSVGATEQMLLSAVRAKGKTQLHGAAIEPEIMDLIHVLQKMGATISVDTDRTIRIEGVERLRGYTHYALPDRIEAASWASAALATGGDIYVKGAAQPDMTTFLNVFRKVGGEFEVNQDGIRFYHPGAPLRSLALETNVHPGFMTDWQQPLVVALTQAEGISIVHETVYEKRFGFTQALNKMGAQIQLYAECLGGLECRFWERTYKHSAVIVGPTPLHGADITIPDLRGGFSHLIAALSAQGTSQVRGVHIISRGYERFIPKLTGLGADITVTDED